jgi:hypothetical protein
MIASPVVCCDAGTCGIYFFSQGRAAAAGFAPGEEGDAGDGREACLEEVAA